MEDSTSLDQLRVREKIALHRASASKQTLHRASASKQATKTKMSDKSIQYCGNAGTTAAAIRSTTDSNREALATRGSGATPLQMMMNTTKLG